MVIDGEWENKVRMMRENGDNEGAKRELRKAKMQEYHKLKNDNNKFFIDYCLAHHCYKEDNYDLANMYLKDIENIFNNDEQKISEMELKYCNYLWLKVNVNSETMTLDEITENMMYIYNYYLLLEKYDIAIRAMANIYSCKGDGEKLLEKLEEILQCQFISDVKSINSFLKDCDKLSHDLYIKALDIVNKYTINIDIV